MRPNSILRKLETLDYVVEGNVIYPALLMTDAQYEQVIDAYVDEGNVNFKIVPLPRRRA